MSKENKPLKAIDADFVSLELDRLELNEGQLDGLPANPREILETKLDLLSRGPFHLSFTVLCAIGH